MMRQRDFEIIKDLIKFRCLSRDDIIDLHFPNVKNKVGNANAVLKRLVLQGHIEVSTYFQPYVYFPSPSSVKKNSQKIPHFLRIAGIYKELARGEKPNVFEVEPKYGKEFMEPDAFIIWKNRPYFLEVQRHHYSQKFMQQKFNRYQVYFDSEKWHELNGQGEPPTFPDVLMITDKHYNLYHPGITVHQVRNEREFIREVLPKLEERITIPPSIERLKIRLS